MFTFTWKWFIDMLERALRTFAQAYFAFWIADEPDFDDLFAAENFKAGVVGLALSIALSVGATKIGSRNTAALLPAGPDTDQG